jgi:hypothetical protein
MKKLKKLIKEEITKLQEQLELKQYPVPPEILDTLRNKLKLNPIIRYISNLKAVNSVPPSYRAFLLNGEFFDIIYEDFSLLVKIGSKEYFLNDIDEKNYAIQHINRLLIGNKIKPEEEEGDEGGDLGGDDLGGDLPPPPPPPPAVEPPEEPEA